jgi:hypothetical protein
MTISAEHSLDVLRAELGTPQPQGSSGFLLIRAACPGGTQSGFLTTPGIKFFEPFISLPVNPARTAPPLYQVSC